MSKARYNVEGVVGDDMNALLSTISDRNRQFSYGSQLAIWALVQDVDIDVLVTQLSSPLAEAISESDILDGKSLLDSDETGNSSEPIVAIDNDDSYSSEH